MKKFRYLNILFLSVLLPLSAHSALLETKPGDRVIEEVKLAKEATLKLPSGKSIELKPYVTGLRRKKVALFWAKVYVGQVFAADRPPAPKTIDEAYETLSKQSAVAVTLSFVRHVTADKMISAFEDAFAANGIDVKADASVKPLFEMLKKGGEMNDKQTMTVAIARGPEASETLLFDNGKGEVQSAAVEKGAGAKILKLWLGKASDSGVERLQKQFLGQED
jgi:hypothetical protein